MYSKRTLLKPLITLFGIWALVLSGCMMKVGEQPPPQVFPKITGTQCLSPTMETVKKFVSGDANEEELDTGWNCLIGAITKFTKYVRGRSNDRYDIQELATFLEENFFEKQANRKLSPKLQTELMRFKKLFLGGSIGVVTRSELDETVEIFEKFRSLSKKVNPYMKLYTFQWQVDGRVHLERDVPFFEQGNLVLQGVAQELGVLIQARHESYELDQVSVFIESLQEFYREKWSFQDKMPHYMNLVKKVKRALAGGEEIRVTDSEWKRFLILGARSYIQYLRYHYFIKNVSDVSRGEQLSYLAKTVEESFDIIHALVAEKDQARIDRKEVLDILEKLSEVWPEFRMSESLFAQVMKLKRLLFGGDEEGWSLSDITRSREKVQAYRKVIEQLSNYYSYLTFSEDQSDLNLEEQLTYFRQVETTLHDVGSELSKVFESDYRYSDLVLLFQEAEALYPSLGSDISSNLKKFREAFFQVKTRTFGTDRDLVTRAEWGSTLDLAVKGYGAFLNYHYIADSRVDLPNTSTHEVLLRYQNFIKQTLTFSDFYLGLKKDHQISFDDFYSLFRQLQVEGYLPLAIKKESIQSVFEVFVENILLSRSDRIEGHVPTAISPHSLQFFKSEYLDYWFGVEQSYFQFLSEGKHQGGPDWAYSRELLEHFKKESQSYSHFTVLRWQEAFQDMIRILAGPINLNLNSNWQLEIFGKKPDVYSYSSLNVLNAARSLSQLLSNALSGSIVTDSESPGLLVAEIEQAYARVRPFFLDLGILDPSDLNFIKNRFLEGNVFTPSSFGDAYLSFNEMTELITMILSGIQIDRIQKQKLREMACVPSGKLRFFTTVNRKCFMSIYMDKEKGMFPHLSSLPLFQKFLQENSGQETAFEFGQMFKKYFDNVLLAASQILPEQTDIKVGQIFLVPHVIQYIEMVFARFDRNLDGIIDNVESEAAYPVFRDVIRDALSRKKIDLDEKGLAQFFTFLLHKGYIPQKDSALTKYWIEFRTGQFFGRNWKVRADRVDLSQILGDLARQVRSKGNEQKNEIQNSRQTEVES